MSCTTILVGRDASLDGSTIIARNEDSPSGQYTPKRLCVVQPDEQPRTYTNVLGHLTIELPDDPVRYTALPDAIPGKGFWGAAGVNVHNVAMTATETITSNPRVLGADPLVVYQPAKGAEGEEGYEPERPGGIGEEDFVRIVLPYITSAREGVLRLGELLERYGTYEMNGIAISDPDEIWWLETVGGHHWIAARVPDDSYVVMPNQLGIDLFDLTEAMGDGEYYLCSADLSDLITENRLWQLREFEADSDGPLAVAPFEGHVIFNPRLVFGSRTDADHVYNTPRAWDILRYFNPHGDWYEPELQMGPTSDELPWCEVPEHLISIEDIKYAESLHYQGTEFDPYGHYGDDSERGRFRPIGINRTNVLSVIQLRPDVPEAISAIEWIAYGSNVFNALVPTYSNIDEAPAYLANTTGVPTTESFYWANRIIGALADAHWEECKAFVERYQDAVASQARAAIRQADEEVTSSDVDYADATGMLERANAGICEMVRRETDEVLDNVLFAASEGMRNRFARSDA